MGVGGGGGGAGGGGGGGGELDQREPSGRRSRAHVSLERPPAPDAPPLTLAHATPDPELLAVDQRVLQAVLADHASPAHFLGLTRRGSALREEQVRVDTHAVGLPLPCPLGWLQEFE